LVEMREHIRAPKVVVDLKRVPGFAPLSCDATSGLAFGATTTARAIETHAGVARLYPGLVHAVRELGSIQVRNRATVIGNLCRASPSADTPPPLIAAGARLTLAGPAGTRECALEDFFTGPGKTVLGPGEVVTGLNALPPAPRTGAVYLKLGRRKAMELATVGVAVSLSLAPDGACAAARIVLGAVAPTPIRAVAAEAALTGRRVDDTAIEAAALLARDAGRPISNVRASAAYRREMIAVLTRRALAQALTACA
jgi:carbon-monoxide dehydrogenase medium subunit